MAFPIPAHLPRRSAPQDVTTQILSKLDAATNKTLNAELARSWVSELDETITLTKTRLHERIQEDLPEFQRQLAASKDVQERLRALTANVDTLSNSVSNPETGLIPSLVRTLTEHAELTEQTTEARVEHEALSHLLACRTSLKSFENLVKDGKLSEAVGVCREVETLLQSTPTYLDETRVMVDIRRKFRSTQARNDEQLSDAYSRSVFVSQHKIEPSSHELTIHASVQVRQSDATIHLPAVMTSLSSNSLSNHLTILRRDLTSLFIDILSRQPVLITVSSEASRHNLVLNPARSKDETLITRLENLSGFFNFLSSHFFPSLPASQSAPFTRALCKPTTTSVLNNLLIPSLPSSFDLLPPFLELTRQAVAFEDRIIIGLLGNDPNDHPIKSWVEGVSGHYERQRRMDILSRSREIIVTPDDQYDTFLVEVEADVAPMAEPSVVPVQDDAPVKDDAWGFDDDITDAGADETVDENSWGFDDDIPAEPEPKSVTPDVTKEAPPPKVTNGDVEQEPDPSETWGWNEGEDVPLAEESAWDDPWADPPAASTPDSAADSRPPPAPSITSPKVAGGLQKAANKGKKKHLDGNSSTSSPVITSPQPSVSTTSSPPLNKPSSTKSNGHPPLRSATTRPSTIDLQPPLKETYLASGRSKLIIRQVEDVLAEGKHLASSSIFPASSSTQTSTAVGTTLLLTAPAVLDLHRALYPVKFSKAFQLIAERLGECAGCLKVLSESWYSDVITREQKALDKILKAGAQGFTYTGDQDRYDECESAMTQVLKEVRRLASRLKGILTKTKYYTAIGLFVEAVLDRTIRDILALPDIPEVESHRLSELCHIFNALEGLFVEDATQSSFVVAYVPSWLKFSYLTELLEASMADITYLFEEGALVDFQVDELVRLVRALFADTQLRTNTITKLTGGHPAPRGQ
ncbi:Centromere/kinetochore protein zw10 like protein [Termitomyces sp. J132]|nr:Centromere/kinetochore protein zw10 like protein [Termitomyces sp. J132]